MYFQKYEKYLETLDRGGLKINLDNAMQMTKFCFVMSNAAELKACRKSLIFLSWYLKCSLLHMDCKQEVTLLNCSLLHMDCEHRVTPVTRGLQAWGYTRYTWIARMGSITLSNLLFKNFCLFESSKSSKKPPFKVLKLSWIFSYIFSLSLKLRLSPSKKNFVFASMKVF